MEEVIEQYEYPATLATGLFGPHEDVPAPTAETPAAAISDPLPVEICESEGGEI